MMINLDILTFLIDNNLDILKYPILGKIVDIFAIFQMIMGSNNRITIDDFLSQLQIISGITEGSIGIKDGVNPLDPDEIIDFIDVFSLKILLNQLTQRTVTPKKKEVVGTNHETIIDHSKTNAEKLLDLIDFKQAENKTNLQNDTLVKNLSIKVKKLLATEPKSFQLARERSKETFPVSEYIPKCNDKSHSVILADIIYIANNKIQSIQISKITDNIDLLDCVKSKIHFIPNIKPQTDLSLGDCSYLDTCHKLNSCRYLHYIQYIPESLVEETKQRTQALNEIKLDNLKLPFYTHGYCCSTASKVKLPPQWIKCDVRKFDFDILGKFSVVIADPAWNIHMNLPYGTCNDIELLELPLDKLQDEGVLFLWVTGRAIEIGKDSLKNWGYEVVNEISWIKTNQLGRTIVTGRTGHWLNHSKEHLLVGVKGNPLWLNKHIDVDLIVSTTRETSRKPDELYEIIERLVGPHARKLEIFGRDHNIRPGWFTIGNQLTGTCIHELDVKRKYDKFIEVSSKQKQQSQKKRQHNNNNINNNRQQSSASLTVPSNMMPQAPLSSNKENYYYNMASRGVNMPYIGQNSMNTSFNNNVFNSLPSYYMPSLNEPQQQQHQKQYYYGYQ
ncbi:hypothetical protein KAFR_0C02930 [Kazachstania africana CBS 2517]|uniref:mRNA m(6)A methyltransferase n=1 Tax=Kazachstania africana (strain ATCC 22294 / BCRC 22015 / CBS 2517 / CECT 1963 / NBRC 1671 / NRRL Y-8276) TaxID=1071382 RepID=H2ASD6_KAZAF|nr:hypothetical protein KAFR_0C02930 [Kazachstania africana CBS 2517]CCF57286.1 hypothetical protein KAFR_0C02930 [Kazachstania africana CBS 2517]